MNLPFYRKAIICPPYSRRGPSLTLYRPHRTGVL